MGLLVTEEEIKQFRELLSQKAGIRRHIRIIGVGEEGVGKTTLCRRLLKRDLSKVPNTGGIKIYTAEMDITDYNIKERKKDGRRRTPLGTSILLCLDTFFTICRPFFFSSTYQPMKIF